MTDVDRLIVLDFLQSSGWKRADRGPSGDLWTRGDAVTVVPFALEAGTSNWNRLAAALASVENLPPDDLLSIWQSHLKLSRDTHSESGPRVRPVPGRVEFEAHLDGITVVNHQTDAYEFGRFVMRTADSVKELVKTRLGIRHYARNLLVAGGPTEGSVQVVFREPDRSDESALFTGAPETAEGQALVYMAGVFRAATLAADQPDADGLRAHLVSIDGRARQSLARVAEVLIDGGWVLSGVIRRGEEESALQLGPHAAHVLSTVSREASQEERLEPVAGAIDGWVWSASELTLITDDRGTIRVSVPMTLQAQVAELNVERDTRVQTQLRVITRIASGTRDTIQTTYALAGIEPESRTTLDE
jgi:hypothetical protein